MQEVRLRVNIIQYEIVIQIEIQRIFQNFLYELKLYKISLFLFLSKRESPYKTTSFFNIVRQRLNIIRNRFYTIHKTNTILRKKMTVKKDSCSCENYMSKHMHIKVTKI